MTERPIIFSAEMVRAILDGRKTQTRRVIKPQPVLSTTGGAWRFTGKHYALWQTTNTPKNCALKSMLEESPYGQPGDRLWVREAWAESGYKRIEYRAFPADGSDFRCVTRWRPSIHMPRWASRITLEITGVRVERVQEISDHDALAEGVKLRGEKDSGQGAYMDLWNSINAKRGQGWDANPWVWVIEFRRVRAESEVSNAQN